MASGEDQASSESGGESTGDELVYTSESAPLHVVTGQRHRITLPDWELTALEIEPWDEDEEVDTETTPPGEELERGLQTDEGPEVGPEEQDWTLTALEIEPWDEDDE